MKTLIAIPARMASVRFPNKPMIMIDGKPMIQRVWEQAISSNLGEVIVACCDPEVEEVLFKKKIKYIRTKKNLKSGTDRVYYAYNKIKKLDDYKLVMNLQGDMPYFNYLHLRKLHALTKDKITYTIRC